jgi:hypothetical protein
MRPGTMGWNQNSKPNRKKLRACQASEWLSVLLVCKLYFCTKESKIFGTQNQKNQKLSRGFIKQKSKADQRF